VVTLEVRGASGRGQRVVFEVHYPGQKAQRMSGITDAHGAVTVRMRVPRELSHNRSALVQVRVSVTVGRHTSVRWVSFRIVPALAARRPTTHGTAAPAGRCGSKGQARGERRQARCRS
jgi:hypothetical protein